MQKIWILLIAVLLINCNEVSARSAPDTTWFSLREAEKIFLQNNLTLLAAKYNIEINRALAEQARLWDNPVLGTDQNIYDGKKGDGKFFRHDAGNGQVFFQLTQLIKTAGKRSKLAQLSTDNTSPR
ncbi:MAG: TolC family protein [Ferruginibacter sp.]